MENKALAQAVPVPQEAQEIGALNDQFSEFLRTRGIKAKFKLAFDNMAESARRQHEADKANFEAVKAKSAEDNKEFDEFLHTKGLAAKTNLVVENIRRGAAEAPARTAAQIENLHASPAALPDGQVSAQALSEAFNAFLKVKGLDGQYSVTVKEEIE